MQLLLSLPFCLVFVKGNLICFSFVIFHCKLPLLCFASLLPSPAFPSLPASFSLSCSAPWSSSHLGIAKPSSCSFESVSHSYGFKAHVYVEEVGCWVPSEQNVLQTPPHLFCRQETYQRRLSARRLKMIHIIHIMYPNSIYLS